ncbi:MAG: acyl-CoA dehydrogenase [Chromatiales bacterium]|jgi:acyl-CoA dehydrogenase|nr:MAG: acyl-CoA dehydrogenase [Chromatiales bacterium]
MQRHLFESEHEIFRDSVRRFFQKEVEPHRDRWYEQGQVDREIYRKGGEQGLLLMQADEQFGGAGIRDFRYEQILIEENLRYGDSGLYFTLHSRLVAPYIEGLGTEEQKRRFLPRCASGETILGIAMTEPGTGSDLASMKTRVEDRGDHFILNGAKTYISNGINGDLFVVAARTGPGRQLGLFLVERDMPGFARGRNLKKMGLKSQDTAELFFENVKVPKGNVLGNPARGFYYLMEYLVEERLISAAQYVAASQIAFDLTLDYIRERRIFGQAVADFQVNRFKMADMRTEIDIAQVFVDHCVMEFNAGRLTAADVARAKLFCSELEGRVTDECVQLHGGAGYMDEYRISRMYRDARVSRIYAGSSEVMREIIARSIGLDPRQKNSGKPTEKD